MDLLNLRALLTLDKSAYEQGLSDAEGQATNFGSKFKGAMGTAAKAGVAALAASATAVSILGKNSISAYADTQQLVGGVQKLYGNMGLSVQEYADSVGKSVSEVNSEWKRNEQAQNIVLNNAKNAFQTAGQSYNQYMEQATSFSASLINSLGGDTVKAAEQTDVAMRAIADNYNTFGGDMEYIQYAFQGFAKQNYTMLDNLKLGYGGTKTEMERLIADANKWAEENGKAADLSIDSFSDVVTAIDYIQQKQGIAGTTAREAATTISGSVGMVKAAWENLMAGMADPDADISQLVQNLTQSVATLGKNIVPAISQFAKGFGTAMQEILPQVISGIPKVVESVVPTITSSAGTLLNVLVQSLSTAAPQLMNVGIDLISNIVNGFSQNSNGIIQSGLKMIQSLITFLMSSATKLLPVALTLVRSLATGILNNLPMIIQTAVTMITQFAGFLTSNAPQIMETGVAIIGALVSGLIRSIPVLLAAIPKLITAIASMLVSYNWMSVGRMVITGIARGLTAAGNSVRSAARRIVQNVRQSLIQGFSSAVRSAVNVFNSLKSGIKAKFDAAIQTIKSAINKIKGMFPFNVGKIFGGKLKLPSISVSKKGDGSASTSASTRVQNFAKALSQPYVFKEKTNFMAGEAGDEVLFGRNALMRDISSAVQNNHVESSQPIVVNLNYNASDDANDMVRDIARGVRRYRMAGAF